MLEYQLDRIKITDLFSIACFLAQSQIRRNSLFLWKSRTFKYRVSHKFLNPNSMNGFACKLDIRFCWYANRQLFLVYKGELFTQTKFQWLSHSLQNMLIYDHSQDLKVAIFAVGKIVSKLKTSLFFSFLLFYFVWIEKHSLFI